ncbi:hypothetical protein NCLIV_021830 [Neospora caninum Liverpool]|uniref:Uncharacterized protein n=1 Tax=Neospora caninum (strain Liverpool) TaxID=572307 RepID=F0VFA0_NEOCL|nr:hypothetical protein NCLIV_021830 [Neospora caninum Liverpool]CBZ52394.1 hypothetical protein NCLIV_021830 [Neospora caninum Liverpool]CEL66365.1 TPA: hypothetical protein BN1204_021830 [Neospora caninum Liverpool]|eukprot:XP_003882426.1 hypothetical protein NCLIV_021830 [Neospora caninum Liverpool]
MAHPRNLHELSRKLWHLQSQPAFEYDQSAPLDDELEDQFRQPATGNACTNVMPQSCGYSQLLQSRMSSRSADDIPSCGEVDYNLDGYTQFSQLGWPSPRPRIYDSQVTTGIGSPLALPLDWQRAPFRQSQRRHDVPKLSRQHVGMSPTPGQSQHSQIPTTGLKHVEEMMNHLPFPNVSPDRNRSPVAFNQSQSSMRGPCYQTSRNGRVTSPSIPYDEADERPSQRACERQPPRQKEQLSINLSTKLLPPSKVTSKTTRRQQKAPVGAAHAKKVGARTQENGPVKSLPPRSQVKLKVGPGSSLGKNKVCTDVLRARRNQDSRCTRTLLPQVGPPIKSLYLVQSSMDTTPGMAVEIRLHTPAAIFPPAVRC